MIEKINLKEKFGLISDYWSPKIVGELNEQMVKIAKVKGEFVKHHHEAEDELFFVLKGKLYMDLDDGVREILPGEMIIIPRNTSHKPYAQEETHILLFEPASTLNTGEIENELTRKELDKI